MNEHLNIPGNLQKIINEIKGIDLSFVEIPMKEHPKLPQFNRTIRILDIDAKSQQEFIVFIYEQVLRDKDTDEEIKIPLPAPEWIMHKESSIPYRDDKNLPIELPLKDDNTQKDVLKVPSYKYMLWLLKNQKTGFLHFIQSSLTRFVEENTTALNKI